MINENIIGFAGRCYSGKSELAKICKKYGYEIKSFATPLKQLIANLVKIPLSDVNKLKNANMTFVIEDADVMFLSKETEIPYSIINDKVKDKVFKNTRQLLQFIGTDIIREYNKDWHVNRIKQTLEKDKKYVFDDVRFTNEREMIRELGGTCWFVVRPRIDNVSNHISETTLKWQDFNDVIINNNSLEFLKFNWDIFMHNGYANSYKQRKDIIIDIVGNKKKINEIIDNNEEKFNLLNALFITEYDFTYKATYLKNDNVKGLESGDGYVKVFLTDDTTDIVKHPLMIEDLKKYI